MNHYAHFPTAVGFDWGFAVLLLLSIAMVLVVRRAAHWVDHNW